MGVVSDDIGTLVVVSALKEVLVLLPAVSTRELAVLLACALINVCACSLHLAHDTLAIILALNVLDLLNTLPANPIITNAINTTRKVILFKKKMKKCE